jgi:FAD/FMN-containing dehydrogenase
VRIANACSDPELFWSIKGGGGGSLGVITRLTLKTHELPGWFGGAFVTIAAASDAAYRRLLGGFLDLYRNRLFNPHWGESVAIRGDNTLAISMVSQGLDTRQAEDILRPFLDWVAASPRELAIVGDPRIGSIPARHWWDALASSQSSGNGEVRRSTGRVHRRCLVDRRQRAGGLVPAQL